MISLCLASEFRVGGHGRTSRKASKMAQSMCPYVGKVKMKSFAGGLVLCGEYACLFGYKIESFFLGFGLQLLQSSSCA